MKKSDALPEKFELENLNLDAMQLSELRELHGLIGLANRPQIAWHWFPYTKGMYKAARLLGIYCFNKIKAMECRLNGEISKAINFENTCESVYLKLPIVARW